MADTDADVTLTNNIVLSAAMFAGAAIPAVILACPWQFSLYGGSTSSECHHHVSLQPSM